MAPKKIPQTKDNNSQKPTALQFIRTIYLSIAAIIGLIMFVIGTAGAVRLVFNTYVFQVNDYEYYSPYDTTCEQPKVLSTDGKTTIPRTAEEIADCKKQLQENNQRTNDNQTKRDLAQSISLAIVGLPVWAFHWMVMQADWRRKKERV
jgi:hypothetical protein